MFTFSPWSLSKLLHCYLANVNWGILQFSPRSTCCACFEEDFQNTASYPSNTKVNEPLQNTGPSLLKKAGEAAPITSHQPTCAATKGAISCRGCKWGCKAALCCEHSATWALSGCSWILSPLTLACKEGESGWQQEKPWQQDPANWQLPSPLSLTHLPGPWLLKCHCHMSLLEPHFPAPCWFSSLNTTLIRCTEINLCDRNSGHTDNATPWLLGNKTPRYHLSCCWEPSSYLFLEDTMENEYKHSLQRIEYGEEIRHDDCAFINIHESECPGQS